MVHSETSTATVSDVQGIGKVTRERGALLLVDGITSVGAIPVKMDDWGIDVLIGGSQKAFMLPAGISFISFSKKAWHLVETSTSPRYYFDVRREKSANKNGESHFSSAVPHIKALDLVLRAVLKAGVSHLHERIQSLAKATNLACREMGLAMVPEVPSPSLSVVRMPASVDSQLIRTNMETRDGIVVMGGQDKFKGKIIRIGHMGAISNTDIVKTLDSLARSINLQLPETIAEAKIQTALNIAEMTLATSSPLSFQN